jgi:hypothetical protein
LRSQGALRVIGFPICGLNCAPVAGCQQIAENSTQRFRQIETALADCLVKCKSPQPFSGAGFTKLAMMPMCP